MNIIKCNQGGAKMGKKFSYYGKVCLSL